MTPSYENVRSVHDHGLDLECHEIFVAGGEKGSPVDRLSRNLRLLSRFSGPLIIHLRDCLISFDEAREAYDLIRASPVPICCISYAHASPLSSMVLQAASFRVVLPSSMLILYEHGMKEHREELADVFACGKLRAIASYGTGSHGQSHDEIRAELLERFHEGRHVLSSIAAVQSRFADLVFESNYENLLELTAKRAQR